MIPLLAWASEALPQTAQQDTVVFVSASEALDRWADVATIALVVLVIVLVFVTIATALQARRLTVTGTRLLADVKQQIQPVAERAQIVADNLGYVSAIVRDDVERLSATVAELAERLNHASDRVEERIEEFHALLEVAQDEAEDLFIDTAATVRGVQAGARTLTEGNRRKDAPAEDET